MRAGNPRGGPPERVEAVEAGGKEPRLTLHGDIDFQNAPEILEAIAQLLERGPERVLIELAGVVFMDSSGISALVDSAKAAREKGIALVLIAPSRQLLHLLEVSGFKPLFDFEMAPPMPPTPPREVVRPPIYWQMSEFRVPCDPKLVAEIRSRVTQLAESLPFTAEELEDIKLAVGEASTNAFRYGCPEGDGDSIGVRCIGDLTGLTIEITDSGPGFDPSRIPLPVPGRLEAGGRGIYFMRLTMDEVAFSRLENGTCVRMVKYLRTRSNPGAEGQGDRE